MRLERNPLRILDSKDPGDREILAGAPSPGESLNAELARLLRAGPGRTRRARHRVSDQPALVRGLDYYTHTAFEFTTTELGAQGAVLAGGRYDGLVATMGGPDTPGIGWAAGVERLAMLLAEAPQPPRPIAVVPIGDDVELPALQLAEELRGAGHHVEFGLRGKVGQRLKRAAQQHARYAILLGEDELARPARSCCATSIGASRTRCLGLRSPGACLPKRPTEIRLAMASAIFDTHAFIKRLTAAGMPEQQAEVLAEESTRLVGEQVATKQDAALLRGDLELLRADIAAMEQRIKDQLTIRLGVMLAAAIAIVAPLVKLL